MKVGKIGNRCSDARSFLSFFSFLSVYLFSFPDLFFLSCFQFFSFWKIVLFVVIEKSNDRKSDGIIANVERAYCTDKDYAYSLFYDPPPGHRSRYRDRIDLKFA